MVLHVVPDWLFDERLVQHGQSQRKSVTTQNMVTVIVTGCSSQVSINCLKLEVIFFCLICFLLLLVASLFANALSSQNFVRHLHEMKQQLRNASSNTSTHLLLLCEPLLTCHKVRSEEQTLSVGF